MDPLLNPAPAPTSFFYPEIPALQQSSFHSVSLPSPRTSYWSSWASSAPSAFYPPLNQTPWTGRPLQPLQLPSIYSVLSTSHFPQPTPHHTPAAVISGSQLNSDGSYPAWSSDGPPPLSAPITLVGPHSGLVDYQLPILSPALNPYHEGRSSPGGLAVPHGGPNVHPGGAAHRRRVPTRTVRRTLEEKEKLETFFAMNPDPTAEQRQQLSAEMGLTLQTISGWFRQRRRGIQRNPNYTPHRPHSQHQRERLWHLYTQTDKPTAEQCRVLSNETGLNRNQIMTWFYHKRRRQSSL